MYNELLKRYKTKEAVGSFAMTMDGRPIYWLLIQLIQTGSYEDIDALASRYGLPDYALKMLIDAAKTVEENFPLSYVTNETTGKTLVRIDVEALPKLWNAAMEISPEHMPPTKVATEAEIRDSNTIESRLLIDIFRNKAPQYNAIAELLSICKTIFKKVKVVKKDHNGTSYIAIESPTVSLVLIPLLGLPEDGFYVGRAAILETRAIIQETANLVSTSVKSIVVSYGFTEKAKLAALLEPKVPIMPIWALLKLIDAIQNPDTKVEYNGLLAFNYVADLIESKGLAPYFDGSFLQSFKDYLVAPQIAIPDIFLRKKRIRIQAIRFFNDNLFLTRFLKGINDMADELGLHIEHTHANNDASVMPSLIANAAKQDVDGIIINHGISADCYPEIVKALDKGIKVVTFDLVVNDERVPEIEMDDMTIGTMLANHVAIAKKGKANVLYMSNDLVSSLVKRNQAWETAKLRFPGLHEVGRFGVFSENIKQENRALIIDFLREHSEVDVIIAMWDEFAKIAAETIAEQQIKQSIKIYSVDIADEDIWLMTQPDNEWNATVAVDPYHPGRVAVRAVAGLLAGNDVGKYILLKPKLITREYLVANKIKDMNQLLKVYPEIGDSDLFWYPWFKTLQMSRSS